MDKQKWTLVGSAGLGLGLGAGLMYLLDPQGGRNRRATARDKCVSQLKKGGSAALSTSRGLGNRTKGLLVVVTTSKLGFGRKAKAGKGLEDVLQSSDASQADLAGLPGVATDLSHGDSLHHNQTPELDPRFQPL
ncbi:MAG: hypothetical protein ACJ75H_15795 [Thermoanaerobaculia bacterium]